MIRGCVPNRRTVGSGQEYKKCSTDVGTRITHRPTTFRGKSAGQRWEWRRLPNLTDDGEILGGRWSWWVEAMVAACIGDD